MKTVILRAPVLTQSGYGVHSRQIFQWLLKRPNVDVKVVPLSWGDTPWLLDRGSHDGLIGQVMDRTIGPDTHGDVAVSVQLPNEWRVDTAPVNVGVSAVVETDRCNPAWIDACNRMTCVVVPSTHAKACLTNTGTVTVPLVVVPEAFPDEVAQDDIESIDLDVTTSFNFLVFGQLTGNNPENDRKNTFYTIKWLCETFKDDPDVGIIVKTNAGRNSLIDRQVTTGIIRTMLTAVRRGPNPRVSLLHGDMSDGAVAALYRHPSVKALVALTRGEGFGLPILEAAASGLPIVATGWSGHLDFLRHGKYVSVYYQLSDVHQSRIDDTVFVKGSRWANPSEEDFKRRIVKFRNNPTVPKQWAADMRTQLLFRYSQAAIERAYDEELGRYL